MRPISVAICCANAADTLGPACESVAWADELVIVDSGSTDGTAEIARTYADQYVVEPWRGYSRQKQFAAGLCRNDWVLVLDSDEEVSPELAADIAALADEAFDRHDVFEMPRRHYLMGRRVRAWWPDYQSRLIHRGRCTWPGESLHDSRQASDASRVGRLRGPLVHKRHSRAGFEDYFSGRRLDARLMMLAREMDANGRRCRWWDLALRPTFAFFKLYVLKGGFLDGTFGLMIAQKTALTTQLKYAALWAIQHGGAGEEKSSKVQSPKSG